MTILKALKDRIFSMDPSYNGSGQNTDPINRDYVIRIPTGCDLNETSMMDKALDNVQR